MKTFLLIAISILLTGCGNNTVEQEIITPEASPIVDPVVELPVEPEFCPDYIMTGQSNSTRDYSHFEDITGFTMQQIGVVGLTIKQLIEDFTNNDICTDNLKGILFIHGEHDALWETPVDEYLIDVEKYRLMIADVPMYLSLVGYTTNPAKDYLFDIYRDAQLNSGYSVSYTEANRFRDWGLLDDTIHFSQGGRDLIAEAFAEDIWNN